MIKGKRLACGRLSTRAEENNQHNETVDDDTPESPPEPPPPPDRLVQRPDKPLRVELEGETKGVTSSEKC